MPVFYAFLPDFQTFLDLHALLHRIACVSISCIWELYAATGVDAVPIRFAGSYQRDDTGETVAVEVVMRGRQKEIDTGEGKQGEDTESKISVVCTYFRLTMDGKELVEIDTINMIEKVSWVALTGAIRFVNHCHAACNFSPSQSNTGLSGVNSSPTGANAAFSPSTTPPKNALTGSQYLRIPN